MEVTLRIFKNKILLSNGVKDVIEHPLEDFSTNRLLVGNFDSAFECVERAGKRLGINGLFKRKPTVIVEPKELIEGGISQIEDRVFRELTMALNPSNVRIVS